MTTSTMDRTISAAIEAAGLTQETFAALDLTVQEAIIKAAASAGPPAPSSTLQLTDQGFMDEETGELVDAAGEDLGALLRQLVGSTVDRERAQLDAQDTKLRLDQAAIRGELTELADELRHIQGDNPGAVTRAAELLESLDFMARRQLRAKVAGEEEVELKARLAELYAHRTQGLALEGTDPESRASFRVTLPKPAIYYTQRIKPAAILKQRPDLAQELGIEEKLKKASGPRVKLTPMVTS